MAEEAKNTTVIVKGGNGMVALIITFFFGPFGAFFAYWFFAKYSFIKSFLLALMWFCLIVIGALLVSVVIGFVILPAVWILMLIFVYKASNSTEVSTIEVNAHS